MFVIIAFFVSDIFSPYKQKDLAPSRTRYKVNCEAVEFAP